MTNEELQADFYSRIYPDLVTDGAAGSYHNLTHRLLERCHAAEANFPQVLEVGAGNGEHFKHVRHRFNKYVMSDVRAPARDVDHPGASFVLANIEALPFRKHEFDRVVATCLLHHLADPLKALMEMRRVSRPGGAVSLMIAADPGMVYRAVRRLTSVPNLRRAGYELGETLHALEHRNHAGSLDKLIRWVFRNDAVVGRGFPLPPTAWWNLNLLAVYQVRRSEN